jgi:hypothetical protein
VADLDTALDLARDYGKVEAFGKSLDHAYIGAAFHDEA